MQYTLVEREGKLYARLSMSDFFNPQNIINYFPLNYQYHEFRMMFHTENEARQALNTPLNPLAGIGNFRFKDNRGIEYRFLNYSETLPDFTEIEPIPEPKHNRNHRVFWKNGRWYKETSKGVTLA